MHSICQRNPAPSNDLYLYIKKFSKIPTLDYPVEDFNYMGEMRKQLCTRWIC